MKTLGRQIELSTYAAVGGLCIILLMVSYGMDRTDSGPLIGMYFLAFTLYFFIYQTTKTNEMLIGILLISVLLRLLFLVCTPNLSDDLYRFIWDGKMWHWGFHPFSYTPSEFVKNLPHLADMELYQKLNSPDYYSVYPPLHQLVFFISTLIYPTGLLGPMIFIRLVLVLAEMVTLYMAYRLLVIYKLKPKNILLYALNPLVILEVSANLHFEGLMICFVTSAVFYYETGLFKRMGGNMAAAIATKLNPMLLLPIMLMKIKERKNLKWFIIMGIGFSLLFFLPMTNWAFIKGLSKSIGLYFQVFEFNASLYNIINLPVSLVLDYNAIQYTGLIMGLLIIIGISIYCYKCDIKLPIMHHAMWIYMIFLVCSLSVHPWYVVPLVLYSIFTRYRFPLVWSLLIFLTYAGYGESSYQENYLILILEYLIVFGFMFLEINNKTKSFKNPFIVSKTKGLKNNW